MTRSSGEYLSLADLADYFGTTVRHARRLQEHIPYTKVGGLVRFHRRDVEEYARSRRVEPRWAS
jgi:excisionase family DNA binding protein